MESATERSGGSASAVALGELSRRDREILAFEGQWWKYAGAKEQAVRELFDMSATRYYQVLNALVEDMFDTMAAAEGVGLAANQIGVDLRLFVYDCPDEETRTRVRGVVVNPVLETSERPEGMPDPDDDEEGCLSVPDRETRAPIYARTPRAAGVTVRGLDRLGRPIRIRARGMLARCFQHETDHLDGRLYVDRLARDAARRVLLQAP